MHFDPNVSAITQVSMRYDGRIPPHMMRAAEKVDAARAVKIARIRVGAVTMNTDTVIALMARAIEQAGAKRQCVTREDFARIGLTDVQIDAHAGAAYTRAVTENPWLSHLEEAA